MTRRAIIASAAGLFAGNMATPAQSEVKFGGGTLTGGLTLTTDYVSRGLTNSDEHPAIQGLVQYTHKTGLLVGAFASSVDFNDDDNATSEVDLWGGYAWTWRGFRFSGEALFYLYPGVGDNMSDDYDTQELVGSISYTSGETYLAARLWYSQDYFFSSGDSYYWEVAASIPLISHFAVELHAGHQDVELNDRLGIPDYNDWLLGISATYQGLKAGVYYTDTDIDRDECFPGTTGRHWCDARVFASLTYGF